MSYNPLQNLSGSGQVVTGNSVIQRFVQTWSGSGNAPNTGIFISINNISSGSGKHIYFEIEENGNDLFSVNSQSGVQIPNGTMGSFTIQPNPGPVTLVEVPLYTGLSSGASGVSNSGQEQSYSFNLGGVSAAKVYGEVDGNSGVQNVGFFINQGFNLGISGLTNTSNFTLGTKPFYVNSSTGAVTWTMPPLNTSTGRTYFIKNRGNTITLTGAIAADQFFGTSVTGSFPITSGQAYIVVNGGQYWDLI